MCTRTKFLSKPNTKKIEQKCVPGKNVGPRHWRSDEPWDINCKSLLLKSSYTYLHDKFGYNLDLYETPEQICKHLSGFPPICQKQWTFMNSIGSGGFGDVYVACKNNSYENDCCYVAKIISIDDKYSIQRFEQEVRLMKQAFSLMNGSVPKVYDSYVCDFPHLDFEPEKPNGIIIMEKMDGTLYDLIRDLVYDDDTKDLISIMNDTLDKVRLLNNVGIFHRDMKALNIGYKKTSNGKIETYILDFGTAVDIHDPSTIEVMKASGPSFNMGKRVPLNYADNPQYDINCLRSEFIENISTFDDSGDLIKLLH